MKTIRLAVIAALAATSSFCSAGAPAYAAAAPKPLHKAAPQPAKPEPKLLPMQPHEVIIMDPYGFDPESKYNPPPRFEVDPVGFLKDPFTWA